MGYTTIGSKYRGISASTRYFVPLDENLEIWQLTVTNDAADAGGAFGIFVRGILSLGRPGRRHQFSAQLQHRRSGNRRRRDLSQDRISRAARPFRVVRLLRRNWPVSTPSARRFWDPIAAGTSLRRWSAAHSSNSVAHGWSPIGAHQVRMVLQPGETRQVLFVLGYHENPEDREVRSAGFADGQ